MITENNNSNTCRQHRAIAVMVGVVVFVFVVLAVFLWKGLIDYCILIPIC